jgi:hypothetical protein
VWSRKWVAAMSFIMALNLHLNWLAVGSRLLEGFSFPPTLSLLWAGAVGVLLMTPFGRADMAPLLAAFACPCLGTAVDVVSKADAASIWQGPIASPPPAVFTFFFHWFYLGAFQELDSFPLPFCQLLQGAGAALGFGLAAWASDLLPWLPQGSAACSR